MSTSGAGWPAAVVCVSIKFEVVGEGAEFCTEEAVGSGEVAG